MAEQLDPDVQRLLAEQVESFEELEALLLLQRSPQRRWSAAEVAAAARLDLALAVAALARLAARQLLEVDDAADGPRYRYAPASPQLAHAVDRLAALYVERPVEIIKQMSANAIERLRSSAARAFSDAFIFKGRRG